MPETTTQAPESKVATYTVPASRLAYINGVVHKLNKRARRLKLPEITVEVTGSELKTQDIFEPGNTLPKIKSGEIQVLFNTLQVTGMAPKLAGWEFAATIEHDVDSGLSVLRRSGSFTGEIPERYRTATADTCEHCNKMRYRKDTYLVFEAATGTFKQVGHTCLRDFLGNRDPHQVIGAAEIWADLESLLNDDYMEGSLGEGGGGRPGLDPYIELLPFLQRTFAVVRVFGFMGSTKARELRETKGMDVETTRSRVMDFLMPTPHQIKSPTWREEEALTTPTEKDLSDAAAALAWVRGFDPYKDKLNDYQHNLYVACVNDDMPLRRAGIVASLPVAYFRHVERESEISKKRAERKPSLHQGEVGKRLRDVVVTVEHKFSGQSDYGTYTLTIAADDNGNMFKWYGNGADKGERVRITGTVKQHADYKGTPQTVLNRVVLTPVFPGYESNEQHGNYVLIKNPDKTISVLEGPTFEGEVRFSKLPDARKFAKNASKDYYSTSLGERAKEAGLVYACSLNCSLEPVHA